MKQLNMVEKKKLEKIAIDDIEKAINLLRTKRSEEVKKAEERLAKTPSAKVKIAFDNYCKGQKLANESATELRKLGFDYESQSGGNSWKLILVKTYSWRNEQTPKEVEEVMNDFDSREEKMRELKREVVINLYTTGMEAKKFLEDLSKTLKSLI